MLSQEKPNVPRSIRKILRSRKWVHAKEVIEYFTSIGMEATQFEKSVATPHIRIQQCVDYWPASGRFYDLLQRKWGFGFPLLKQHMQASEETFKQYCSIQEEYTEVY